QTASSAPTHQTHHFAPSPPSRLDLAPMSRHQVSSAPTTGLASTYWSRRSCAGFSSVTPPPTALSTPKCGHGKQCTRGVLPQVHECTGAKATGWRGYVAPGFVATSTVLSRVVTPKDEPAGS